MATIRIQRTSEYANRIRNYQLYIDEQKVGTIADGERKDIPTTSGQHSIVAKIDWCSSPEIPFYINDNETKTFKAGGFKNGKWIILVVLGIIVLHFILKFALGIDYIIYLVIPAFLPLVYYITIGRKKYLTLTEIPS